MSDLLPPSSPPLSDLTEPPSTPAHLEKKLTPVTPITPVNFPSSDTSILDRTPHIGTKAQRLAIARRHGIQARKRTLEKKKAEADQNKSNYQQDNTGTAAKDREAIMKEVLAHTNYYDQNWCWVLSQ